VLTSRQRTTPSSVASATRSSWRPRRWGRRFSAQTRSAGRSPAPSLAALEGRLPEAYAATAEFRSPLGIPGRARLRLASEDGGWGLALERPDGARIHMTGSIAAGAA
jgi:hypothetical protein